MQFEANQEISWKYLLFESFSRHTWQDTIFEPITLHSIYKYIQRRIAFQSRLSALKRYLAHKYFFKRAQQYDMTIPVIFNRFYDYQERKINLDMAETQKGLGSVLKLLRIANNLAVKDLATKMEVSSTYITEVEANNKNPSLNTLTKYSEALGVSKSTILYFEEENIKHGYGYQMLLLKILENITKNRDENNS